MRHVTATWHGTGSTLVNVSVESRSPHLSAHLQRPEKPPKTRHWEIAKREINLYINCVKWICLQFKRLSILSSPSALFGLLLLLLFMLRLRLALIWLICQHSHWPRACFNCDLCRDKFSLNWPQFSRILSHSALGFT